MHTCGSLRGSVTAVVERWILTVPLSPFLAAGALPPPAVGAAPAPGPAKASVKATATSVTPSRNVSRVRQVMMVMKTPFGAGETRGYAKKRRRPGSRYADCAGAASAGPCQAITQRRSAAATAGLAWRGLAGTEPLRLGHLPLDRGDFLLHLREFVPCV